MCICCLSFLLYSYFICFNSIFGGLYIPLKFSIIMGKPPKKKSEIKQELSAEIERLQRKVSGLEIGLKKLEQKRKLWQYGTGERIEEASITASLVETRDALEFLVKMYNYM